MKESERTFFIQKKKDLIKNIFSWPWSRVGWVHLEPRQNRLITPNSSYLTSLQIYPHILMLTIIFMKPFWKTNIV